MKRLRSLARKTIDRAIWGGKPPLYPAMEAVYQQIVQRDLVRLGIEDIFYPVAGAASYSLFYLLIRAACELPIKSVLELGAGESSRLLDALAKSGKLSAEIMTLEHNPEWADFIAPRISHTITRTSLLSSLEYDLTPVKDCRNVNLLLIDGPPAVTEFARLGALNLVDCLHPTDFLVIFDDAHRSGEMLLVDKFEAALRSKGKAFRKGQLNTTKRQIMLAGGALERAAFF